MASCILADWVTRQRRERRAVVMGKERQQRRRATRGNDLVIPLFPHRGDLEFVPLCATVSVHSGKIHQASFISYLYLSREIAACSPLTLLELFHAGGSRQGAVEARERLGCCGFWRRATHANGTQANEPLVGNTADLKWRKKFTLILRTV